MNRIKHNFKVTSQEVIDFANSSGDWNPIHYDKEISRRYITEEPISHGILTLLKVLNEYSYTKQVHFLFLKCNFIQPIYPNFEYKLFSESISTESDNLYLFSNNILIFNCNLKYDYEKIESNNNIIYKEPKKSIPLNPSFKDLKDSKGRLDLLIKSNFIETNFSSLIKSNSIHSLVSLISTSRLVGMVCPGFNSLYSSLSVSFTQNLSYKYLQWNAISTSRKFLPINIIFKSSGLEGSLSTFYREELVDQLSIQQLKTKVKIKEFSVKNILVIGGSRGLGELTAKLLSMRKANLTLTFNKGNKDANRIVKDIIDSGGKAKCAHLNVLNLDTIDEFIKSHFQFDQIYVYASPRIKESTKCIFDFELFEKYNSFYVKTLLKLVEAVSKNKSKQVNIFYPSTIFLDEEINSAFSEYTSSKLLGETIGRNISKKYSNIKIISSRLPRMLTDQTSKVNSSLIEDSAKVMNRILDQMYL